MRRNQRHMQHRVPQGKATSGGGSFPLKATSWALPKLVIALLIGVAALAIGATMLEKAIGIFEAWLSVVIGYLMYPVASA